MLSNVPSRQSPDFAQRTPARVALLGPARSIHTIRWANGLALRGLQVHLLSLETPDLSLYDERIVQYRLPWRAPLELLPGRASPAGTAQTHRPGSAQRSLCDRLRPVSAPRPFLPVLLSAWGGDIYGFELQYLAQGIAAAQSRPCDGPGGHQPRHAARNARPDAAPDLRYPVWHRRSAVPTGPIRPGAGRGRLIVIGTVKALETHYGIDTLIQAFALLRQALAANQPRMAERLVLRIYGAGSQLQRLRAPEPRPPISRTRWNSRDVSRTPRCPKPCAPWTCTWP